MHIVLVEYPGYSIYNTDKDADKLQDDALIVYDYLTNELNVDTNNIYIYGRSIGTGPALFICSKRKPAGLILMSPFTSIQAVAEVRVGKLLKFLISERFINIEYIKHVTCPILFIHGQQDTLIPFSHTIKLKQECTCPYEVILPENMDHDVINNKEDLITPMENFLLKHTDYTFDDEYYNFSIPEFLHDVPKYIKNKFN